MAKFPLSAPTVPPISPLSPPPSMHDRLMPDSMAADHPVSVSALPKTQRKVRIISCRPCRERKVRCDRLTPCKSCIRHSREDECFSKPFSVVRDKMLITKANEMRHMSSGQQSHCSALNSSHNTPPTSVDGEDEAGVTTLQTSSHDLSNLLLKSVEGLHMFNHSDALMRSRLPRNMETGGEQVWQTPYLLLPNVITKSNLPFTSFPVLHNILESTGQEFMLWKLHVVSSLPSRSQCDLLVSYFFENINYIYQAIHAPTFRKQYSEFWDSTVKDVNLIWVSLLYIIMCLSGMHIPVETSEAMGFQATEIRKLAHLWYSISRQCLHAGNFESKPCLTQLQTFLLSQLYWYATKNVETLNSCLGQALRNAQAIGLDKEKSEATNLRKEMRHRIWWDLCSSDTFQSLCLNRQPFIQAHLSEVPIPQNCNDNDITETSIHPRPMDEPTVSSMNVYRAKVFKLFNKLYSNNGTSLSSFDFVSSIDSEVSALLLSLPWYFQMAPDGTIPCLPSAFDFIPWQHHLLCSCICVQRIRMYRPFLRSQTRQHQDSAWTTCVSAAYSSLLVYKSLRNADPAAFQRSQKFLSQTYQIFAAAILLATFLLVERPSGPSNRIRDDVEMVIEDLKRVANKDAQVPMAVDGRKALRKILNIYESRIDEQDAAEERVALVPEIYSVMGGQNTTRSYLERCAITYIVNDKDAGVEFEGQRNGQPAQVAVESALGPGTIWNAATAAFNTRSENGWDMEANASLGSQTFDIPFDDLSWQLGDFLFPDENENIFGHT